nr:glycosyltransferase [Pseudonocardia sp. C8]
MPPTSGEPVTVVVATRGRPDSVRRCVRAILAGDHPAVTVLVVDNDPRDDRTRAAVEAVADTRVRYVREPRRGASVGRNRGLHEARTGIVAFTDDDTEPDPRWASRIAGAFAADPQLTGLSGPVLAARLDTPQERAADVALAWNKGFVPRRFRLDDPPSDTPVFPFSPGLFGIGANLAVRAGPVRALGGFDEALGPGRPTRGGEDIELLVRIVLAGGTLGYLPAAYVWHHHRPSDEELRDQLAGYALGLGAFLGKVAMDPRARRLAMRRFPAGIARLREIVRRESAGRPGEGAPRSASGAGSRRAPVGGGVPVDPPVGGPGAQPVDPEVGGPGAQPVDPPVGAPCPLRSVDPPVGPGSRVLPADRAVSGVPVPGGGPGGAAPAAIVPAEAGPGRPAGEPGGDAAGAAAEVPVGPARRHDETVALPGGAARRKLRGLVSGPALYLRTRRQVRDEGGVSPPLTGGPPVR